MSRFLRTPSPAMVVAVVALSLALVGSAVAGTSTLNKGVSKSKVKKIAKKQIKKAAPGLSVAHADTAAGPAGGALSGNYPESDLPQECRSADAHPAGDEYGLRDSVCMEQKYGVTVMCAAPAVVASVLEAAETWDGEIPGRGTTRIIVAGAPPPTHTVERLLAELGWEFIQIYGLTETSPLLTINRAP